MLEIPATIDESVQMMNLGKGFVRVITRVETYPKRVIKRSALRKAVQIDRNEDGTLDISLETETDANWQEVNIAPETKDATIEITVANVADQLRDIGFEIE